MAVKAEQLKPVILKTVPQGEEQTNDRKRLVSVGNTLTQFITEKSGLVNSPNLVKFDPGTALKIDTPQDSSGEVHPLHKDATKVNTQQQISGYPQEADIGGARSPTGQFLTDDDWQK